MSYFCEVSNYERSALYFAPAFHSTIVPKPVHVPPSRRRSIRSGYLRTSHAPSMPQETTKIASSRPPRSSSTPSTATTPPAIETMLASQMQQALPPDKATPFFRGLVAARGKLKEAGTRQSQVPPPP